MHAYVRHKLHLHYGDEVMKPTGPMPAHLLGNMWAQFWGNTIDLTKPYPDKPNIDVTDALVENGWTVKKIFQTGNDFFKSLGLASVSPSFWSG